MALHHLRADRPTRFDRLSLLSVGIVLFVLAIIGRLFVLQVLNHGLYVALAEGQYALSEKLVPKRGEIFFRDATNPDDLLPLATNRELRLVYAVPKSIQDPTASAEKIAELLNLDPLEVFKRLQKPNDSYEPIAHEVAPDVAKQLEALKLPGIGMSPETTRSYPFGDLAGPVTGFLGYDGDQRSGQYGLEGFFEKQLAGEAGHLNTRNDASGRSLTVGNRTIQVAKDGDDLLLTIDHTVQQNACQKLQEAVLKHGATGGQVIIVQPATGAILAMCSEPSFDPNHYRELPDPSIFLNGGVFDQYEPGSVIKAMTLSAALDQGLITPETTYEDKGSVQIGKYTIRNSDNKTYGEQSMNQVLEQSINTGAIFAVNLLGSEKFRGYMERFGFGAKTGIEQQGESDGDISALSKKGDIYAATGSFGQGLSVTPIQLVMAYAAIVNNGVLMEPHLVSEIIKPNGFHQLVGPREVRRAVSAETAQTMKAMLINVVRNGHGKAANVAGYYVGGKTGTAQVPYGDRPGYYPDKHIGTFVGYAPLADPAFVMLTKIDDPKDVRFAESSAAPLFGDLAAFLLNYYRIPPDDVSAKP